MIKPFVSFVLVLILMVFVMGSHYLLFPHKKTTESMLNITSLTHISSLSLSLSYDESSFNRTYPEMPTLGKMDFLYER
ncbi:MAG: hypothetical protein COB07_05745 [Sulfurovum sp.]|nr:MAG: hypothetical protein COB07_05745 [Sulfurovum sp.]